ncbi:hypothetical protein HBB16_08600 [Pseudonocardia sp. MCCB 268]|nr:hypothetical protein [Pseudonocardia cytotoxica]
MLVWYGRTPSNNVRHALDTALPGPRPTSTAARAAREIAGLLVGWPVWPYAFLGDLAWEIAAPISAALALDVRLCVWRPRDFRATLRTGLTTWARRFDEIFYAWWDGDVDRRMPGGESAPGPWGPVPAGRRDRGGRYLLGGGGRSATARDPADDPRAARGPDVVRARLPGRGGG